MPGYSFADYTPQVLDHFENPRNLGEVDDPDAAGRAGNAACGDVMDLTLRVRNGRIEQARVRVTGCPAAIASASITTVLLTGLTLTEAALVTNPQVAAALGGLPRAKLHCSVLAEEAILAALESYQRRGPGGTTGA